MRDPALAALLSYATVLSFWAVNENARDLEDPFVYDPSNLPLSWHQYRFNERLLAAARAAVHGVPAGATSDASAAGRGGGGGGRGGGAGPPPGGPALIDWAATQTFGWEGVRGASRRAASAGVDVAHVGGFL